MAEFNEMKKFLKSMQFDYEYAYSKYWNTPYLQVNLGNYKVPLVLKFETGNATTITTALTKTQIINIIRKKIIDVEISRVVENRIYHQSEITNTFNMYALSDKELDSLESFNKTGSVSMADLKLAKQKRNELFESSEYLNEENIKFLRYKVTNESQRRANDKYDKANMAVVSGKYQKEFVQEFKNACAKLDIKQSDVFKEAMKETIEKSKKSKA